MSLPPTPPVEILDAEFVDIVEDTPVRTVHSGQNGRHTARPKPQATGQTKVRRRKQTARAESGQDRKSSPQVRPGRVDQLVVAIADRVVEQQEDPVAGLLWGVLRNGVAKDLRKIQRTVFGG